MGQSSAGVGIAMLHVTLFQYNYMVPPECHQLLSILATIAFIQTMELVVCAIRVAGDLLTVLHTISSACTAAQLSSSKCWASMDTTCKRGGLVVQGKDPRDTRCTRLTRFLVFQCLADRVQNRLYRLEQARVQTSCHHSPGVSVHTPPSCDACTSPHHAAAIKCVYMSPGSACKSFAV